MNSESSDPINIYKSIFVQKSIFFFIEGSFIYIYILYHNEIAKYT